MKEEDEQRPWLFSDADETTGIEIDLGGMGLVGGYDSGGCHPHAKGIFGEEL